MPKNCTSGGVPVVCAADKKIFDPAINSANNRLSTSDNYAFDNAGNTTIDAQGRTFTYDGENKQTEVKNASNVTIGQYTYDGDGKRVKKYVPDTGETTVFVYDASGKLVAEYSTIVASTNDAKVSYLTNDNLGSPRINTDQNGAVIARHDYMPFGEEINGTGGRTAGLKYGDDAVRKQFTGYERDQETDLDFGQARYYSNKLGRFYAVDPENAGSDPNDAQSWNAYSYSRNNPSVIVDPTGRKYVYCDTNNVCVEYSDKEFQGYIHNLPDGFERVKGEDGNGQILLNGEVVATYSRPYVDFGSPFAEGVVNDLSRRAPATVRLMTYGAAASASIVAAPYVADLFVAAYGSQIAGNLSLRAFASSLRSKTINQLTNIIKGEQKELINKFLGSGREALRSAIETVSQRIPPELTRRTLLVYAEIARRAIETGNDGNGAQAYRLQMVEEALKYVSK